MMKSILYSFLGPRTARAVTGDQKSPKMNVSPSSGNLYHLTDCGNLACNEFTDNTSTWREVVCSNRVAFVCSEECYREWLTYPGQMLAWSPERKPAPSPKDPPPIPES